MEKLTREQCAKILEVYSDAEHKLYSIKNFYRYMINEEENKEEWNEKWKKAEAMSILLMLHKHIHITPEIVLSIKENSFKEKNDYHLFKYNLTIGPLLEYSTITDEEEKREYLEKMCEEMDISEIRGLI